MSHGQCLRLGQGRSRPAEGANRDSSDELKCHQSKWDLKSRDGIIEELNTAMKYRWTFGRKKDWRVSGQNLIAHDGQGQNGDLVGMQKIPPVARGCGRGAGVRQEDAAIRGVQGLDEGVKKALREGET